MSPWNEAQRRAILSGLLDVQHRLEEMETLLARSHVASPFTQYVDDLSPTERKILHEYLEQLRRMMLTFLDEFGIPLEVCRTSLRRALQAHLADLHSALTELGPSHLSGFGPMNEASETKSLKLKQTLTEQIEELQTHLRQGQPDA
jgi:DNA-binding transcriptional MerR regulator